MSTVTKPISNGELICTAIAKNEEVYGRLLPTHISPAKFIRAAQSAIISTKDLSLCTKQSIYLAVEQAAKDGLPIDNKQATIVVFNTNIGTKEKPNWVKEAKYTPMVAGLRTLMRNTGLLTTDVSEIVYEKDDFLYHIKNGKIEIDHSPKIFGDRGKPIGAYSSCIFHATGEVIAEVLTAEQVANIRKCSKSPGSLMWTTFWEEGWKKSALRRMSKKLPSSSDKENSAMARLASAVQRDDDLYEFDNEVVAAADVTPAKQPEQPKPTKAAAAVAASQNAPANDEVPFEEVEFSTSDNSNEDDII